MVKNWLFLFDGGESNVKRKTNSITHLVKIVAAEVFEEKIGELFYPYREQVIDLGGSVAKLNKVVQVHTTEVLRSSLENVGAPWTEDEDNLLTLEVKTALAVIAKTHGRTVNAVRSRIRDKRLVSYDVICEKEKL